MQYQNKENFGEWYATEISCEGIAFKFKKIDYFELYMEHSLKKEEKGTRWYKLEN